MLKHMAKGCVRILLPDPPFSVTTAEVASEGVGVSGEVKLLFLTLIWLSGEVGTGAGDVAGGADYRPTDASLATLASLEKDLVAAKAAYASLMTEVARFNKAMAGKIPPISDKLAK